MTLSLRYRAQERITVLSAGFVTWLREHVTCTLTSFGVSPASPSFTLQLNSLD